MNKLLLIAISSAALLFYSWKKDTNTKTPLRGSKTVSDTIHGDFNGDKVSEDAWMEVIPCYNGELKELCYCVVRFSDENIKTIELWVYCIRGGLWNEGDLNDDGADDLAVVTYGETDWSFCSLYSYKKRRWAWLTDEFAVWGGVDPNDIVKHPEKKGYIIIRELTAHDSIAVEARTVKME